MREYFPGLFYRTLGFLTLLSLPVLAQRPVLLTESVFTSGAHKVDLYVGAEYFKKSTATFPNTAESLTRLAMVGWHQGVAENVNIDLDWRGYLFATLGNGTRVNDWGDLTISTRVRIVNEKMNVPAIGFRTSVKLPNTKFIPHGLGSNQTDYYGHLLLAKHLGTVETRVNAGFGIVGDPKNIGSQDDVYLLATAVVVPANSWLSLFAEVYGLVGYYDDDDKLVARFGSSAYFAGFEWNLYGSARLAGSTIDIGGAFEVSESWGIGFAVKKALSLDFLQSE
ncbi:MAG: hypothetical protein ACRDGA_08865 [Bacteroidota bacterium]